MNHIQKDVGVLFLLGDLFDFWFEYKTVVPKGFVRVLGKLAELSDQGVEIHFFAGNHDLWIQDYFQKELSFIVHHTAQEFTINQKKIFCSPRRWIGSKRQRIQTNEKGFHQ